MANENLPRASEVDLSDLAKVLIIGIVAGIFLAGIGVGGAWWWTERSRPTANNLEARLQEQYYRGIYDVCVWEGARGGYSIDIATPLCLDWIEKFRVGGWYEAQSDGYKFEYREATSIP